MNMYVCSKCADEVGIKRFAIRQEYVYGALGIWELFKMHKII